MLSNPDYLRQALDNPLVQSLTSNPEFLRTIMMNNPQMQQLVEASFFIWNLFLRQKMKVFSIFSVTPKLVTC